jgi:hypothetical protein
LSNNNLPLVRSSDRTQKALEILTWGIPLLFVASALWLFSSYLLDRRQFVDRSGERLGGRSAQGSLRTQKDGELESYAHSDVWKRNWRQGASRTEGNVVPQPERSPEVMVPVPNMESSIPERDTGLRLIGTFIEKDRSMGLAISPDGRLTFFREGDALEVDFEKLKVDRITTETAFISYRDRSMNWTLGQPLKVKSTQPSNLQPKAMEANSGEPKQVPMDLIQELDSLNGPKP